MVAFANSVGHMEVYYFHSFNNPELIAVVELGYLPGWIEIKENVVLSGVLKEASSFILDLNMVNMTVCI